MDRGLALMRAILRSPRMGLRRGVDSMPNPSV